MGRMIALRKFSSGVRGIVVGDVIRRLVARTVAQQVSSNMERATAPYQYALSTRAGCECVSHVVQVLCEANPHTTIISVDGVSAYDTISREAMMHGLLGMEGGENFLPFVRQFYGRVSQYLWDDVEGVTHTISQGEGGDQGDPLMPMLYSLGQHRALEAVNRSLRPGETLMAFLDDVYVVTPDPDRVGAIYTSIQEHLWVHSSIRIDGGKTQVWNGAGQKAAICEVLDRVAQVAQVADPGAKVWKGSEVPSQSARVEDLGSPVWPPRERRSPVGEQVPQAGHSHPEDSIGPRSASRMVDPDALRQCSGKLLAQSHRSLADAAVRPDARSEIVALFVRILGNRTQTFAMMPRGVLPLCLWSWEDWV